MKGVIMHAKPMVVFLIAAFLAGCLPTEAQRRALEDGFAKYSARQFVESESIANEYIKQNPTVDNIDEAYYLRGLARFSRNNKQGASEDLLAAIEKTKRSDLKGKAYRTLGDIAFDGDKWQQAFDYYQQSLTAVASASVGNGAANGQAGPRPKADAYLHYRSGAALQNLGQWDKARPFFQTVIATNSDPAQTARSVTRINARNFSLQFGAFSESGKAAELIRQLKAANITATASTEMRESQLLYLVRSGTYGTYQEAEVARGKLLAKYPAVVVVP
jgi:tetratricopeptide (TPR) repeat protein